MTRWAWSGTTDRLSSVFSPDGTLISASAAPHCRDTEKPGAGSFVLKGESIVIPPVVPLSLFQGRFILGCWRGRQFIQYPTSTTDSKWHLTTADGMKLYITINVMMGIHILPHVENYWSTDDKLNGPCISRLMSRTRSEKLGQYLHLNDRSDYTERGQ